jgi:type I restriction enzyme S subunit
MTIVTDYLDLWTSATVAKSVGRGNGSGRVQPYGVWRLRALILELAVSGKLVRQDSNDEPASVLLSRTIAERKRRIEGHEMRDSKAPSSCPEPQEHCLPDGWVWSSLHEIGEIAPRNEANDDQDASFVPMNLISENYGDPVIHEVRPWKDIKGGFTHFREGDVVLAKITPCFQNGKSAVMRGLTNGFGAGTTELHVYRGTSSVTIPEYVLIYLKSPRFIAEGIPKMTGTAGQKRITRDYFAGNRFPLPPTNEQRRIVTRVNELMVFCDRLEQQHNGNFENHQILVETLLATLTDVESHNAFREAWKRIADHFDTLFTTEHSVDQLKDTILEVAAMGKLVSQDPHEEPASALLEDIDRTKRRMISEGSIKQQASLPEIAEHEKPYLLPRAWEWSRLGSIAYQITDGAHHTPVYVPDGVPFLSVKDMSTGELDFSETRYISTEQHKELTKRCHPQKGDLLLTKIGTTGVPVLVETDQPFSLFVSVALIKFPQERILGTFLSLLVKSPLVKAQSEEGTEGVGNKNLVLRKIAAFVLPIPPMREQRRIVTKVDELMALCDNLKARLADARTIQVRLADAIVNQAVA